MSVSTSEPTAANGAARTHRLRVVEVVAETPDARSLVLRPPPESAPRFVHRPGQFLTLKLPGADGPVARCYSLASSPHTGEPLKVTVKRVAGGYGSNWVCDHLAAGDEVEALPPAGTFTPDSLDHDLLLVAGGSGITPVLSIAKSVLAAGAGRIVLLYANRDETSVIFRDELRALTAAHPERLLVVHWLESLQGLPVPDRLAAALAPYADREAFVCGPGPLMDAVEQALRTLGAPGERIHRERFFSLSGNVFDAPAPAPAPTSGPRTEPPASGPRTEPTAVGPRPEPTAVGPRPEPTAPAPRTEPAADDGAVTVELDGETRTVAWPPSAPLLDALLAAGVDAPYSCREGACSACTCRVVTGEVRMVRNEVLDDRDLADGYVLACQALPLTDRVEITYS